MRSELAKVRGLGAAHTGTAHFIAQRMSGFALFLLGVFLLASLMRHVASDYATMIEWAKQPLVATLLIALVGAVFYHARLGLQVVIEDYIHHHGNRLMVSMAISFLCVLGALFGVVCILKIALGA